MDVLDLTILSWYGKVAVHCDTDEKAQVFVNAICDQYPESASTWHRGDTKWWWYETEQCYAPHIFDGMNNGKMQFCEKKYWVNHGYTVISFDELLLRDLGEITPSTVSVDQLFEIGV